MVYEVKVTIYKPLEEVVGVMTNPDHAFKWMSGLTKHEHIEGTLGALNSKYLLTFDNGKKTTKMTETITQLELPSKITTVYEMKGVWNECINLFQGHADHTHYKMITTFKFPWYMSIFMWMFKGMFIKESEKGLKDFKEYVESL